MKLLIGGSPCTYWSIAQTKNRETEASGMGWELFKNYVIARDKFRPDYFLYENNKSMSPAGYTDIASYEYCGTLDFTVYKVEHGLITIKGKQYPIKLRDGCYIIRKLTVTECKRLQTVPEWYVFPVSDSQAYKMLGNGWTVEVIMHLMRHFDGITTEPLDVLSMYDGMACGHIALENLGAVIRHYWATEIDKYAIQTATHNFPDIVELGDAFQVREEDWRVVE